MTDMVRLKKLTALLAIAFAWAHKSGEWKSATKVIKIKKHGRPAVSLFRVGLDYVTAAIVNAFVRPKLIQECLKIFQKMPEIGLTGVVV